MKKLVKVEEIEGEGLLSLIGQRVTLYCVNYIYTGDLVGVNTDDVLLENPAIVYDTGPHDGSSKTWANAQKLPNSWYVRTSMIESYGIMK